MTEFNEISFDSAKYDTSLKIYVGGGANSAVLTSKDGRQALLADTKYFKGAQILRKSVKSPDITIVNTHLHMDHTRGNRLYPGAYVVAGVCSWRQWDIDTGFSKRPDKILNPQEEMRLNIGNENVRIINMGSAHSWADCVIYFETRKILLAGDLIWVKVHPMLMDPKCSVSSWLDALHKIETEFDINTIVPGHGDISGRSALIEMREYFLSIKEALNDPGELSRLKNKYKIFKAIPFITGFERTVHKIKNELNKSP